MQNAPARILVVDDEPDLELLIRQRFRQKIKNNEYVFDFALNGKQALDKIANSEDFDMIMTDINMPEMDGLTLLSQLRELKKHVKAVVVSAYSDLQNIRTAMNRGAFDFLTKPIDFSDLETTINKTINEYAMIKQGLKAKADLIDAQTEKERAQQSEKFKQQFLSNMSHEIRTPLNAVIGMTNLLLDQEPKEGQLRYLRSMKLASHNLLGIINDILDLAKIEAGKIDLEQIDFSLNETLEGVINTLQVKADEKKIKLNYTIHADVPEFIKGDPVRLTQILINLLSNAIKFTEVGGVSLTVDLHPAQNANTDLLNLSFKVIDTGIGIAPENIDKIFESFTQASGDTTRKYGGTGLGLTITRQLIDLHLGTVNIQSELGKGTTFEVIIPYQKGEFVESALSKIISDDNIQPDKPLHLLLVEDQPFNQMVAVDTLQSLFNQITVDVANNGREAVEMVMGTSRVFDLILMDIQMPEMDGYEATMQIRSLNDEKGKTRIMAMTANVIKEEIDKCFASGMNDFIAKPFEPAQLKQKILQLV